MVVPRSLRDKVVRLAHEGHQRMSASHCGCQNCRVNPGKKLSYAKHSRWIEVEFVSTTSAQAVIPKLDTIFSSLGIPLIVGSHNGPPFNGHGFLNFSK